MERFIWFKDENYTWIRYLPHEAGMERNEKGGVKCWKQDLNNQNPGRAL